MKIHENAALLDAFVDGELTAAEMAEVQEHAFGGTSGSVPPRRTQI